MLKKFFSSTAFQISLESQLQQHRLFSTTACVASKRSQLRKPNYSSLSKHLRPDGLNGRERRNVLRAKLKESRPKSSKAPYIPVARRLEAIPGTAPNQQQETVSQLSARLATQTFDDLGLQAGVIDAVRQGHLKHVQDARPSEIQALAIPPLLKPEQHRNVLVAAETGSGKTLAYLLPVIDRLKQDEKKQRRRLDHPRAIVLVPTRELVKQVVQTAKSLAHITKFRALGVDSKVKRRRLAEQLEQPVDVLVATPTTLCSLVRDGTLSLADTRHLVVDEADSLFDAGWGDDVRFILDRVGTAQCIIVSATLPRSVHRTLDTLFGERLLKLTTPSLHRALPNLKQSFVDLARFNGNRQLALLDVLKRNIKDDKTLVFCNTRKSAQLLHDWLGSKDMPVLALHKDAERSEILNRFACQDESGLPGDNVLISTDIASRGIDTTFVDHVVLYDFPSSVVDYLHRVGRTARAGRTGKATSLIGRKDKMMADRIRRSIREGSVLS
ncbi:hypothetical protein O0I10_012300 [Lichtheimia ornata]|uniref:P-loop containing nucleoside triphosphate hydrolase protein n=1 Tax=Lichtheimia ornata TaxID=688661 RepID=A0AAD7XPP2_9FUNG|nr:uncharacterized protein O0I10_012300 [Lichtheimia ornata]KAJ8652069.1 hypothetical protein O0I10_012300 [Lichtheimia ornata]